MLLINLFMQLHYIDGFFKDSTLVSLKYFYICSLRSTLRYTCTFVCVFTLNEIKTHPFTFFQCHPMSIQQIEMERTWTWGPGNHWGFSQLFQFYSSAWTIWLHPSTPCKLDLAMWLAFSSWNVNSRNYQVISRQTLEEFICKSPHPRFLPL